MNLSEQRRAIRPLLKERDPADAMDAYYAYHHPDNRTRLVLHPPESTRASGYVAISRTGIDLFRPLLTMRLPADQEEAVALIYRALPAGAGVFISSPADYGPLLYALFEVQVAQNLHLYRLDPADYEPEINVLVTRATTFDGLPRFQIRATHPGAGDELAASASLNWQSPGFAEIAVGTQPQYRQRGWGKSVVSALSGYVLESGRIPLYVVAEDNEASISLARRVGFRDTGVRRLLLEATLRPQP